MVALFLTCAAWAWPADFEWNSLSTAAGPMGAHESSSDAFDLVGDAAQPALWWTADASEIWFRVRIAADPQVAGEFSSGSWGVFLDADSDPNQVDAALVLSTEAGVLELRENPGESGVPDQVQSWAVVRSFSVYGSMRRDQAGSAFFLDLVVPRASLLGGLGAGTTTPIRSVPFTAVGGEIIDVACDLAAACDDPDGLLSVPWQVDADGDGMTDPMEVARGGDPLDRDSDDDGVLDGDEGVSDSDGGGSYNLVDCDADNDGLLDGLERSVLASELDPDTDLSAGCFLEDADPTTSTDARRRDSDRGGLWDNWEDLNRNGIVDGAWETDPTVAEDDVDSDGDWVSDVLELRAADGDVMDEDSDGDGIPDWEEWLYDVDGDGLPGFTDTDSDGDGIPDVDETNADQDGDGTPNYNDVDSDNDGFSDFEEGREDNDRDGVPNYLDTDMDGDGQSDASEGAGDSDCDGVPNWRDPVGDDSFCDEGQDVPGVGEGGVPDVSWPTGAPDTSGGRSCASTPVGVGWWATMIWMAGLLGMRRSRIWRGRTPVG